MHDKAADNLAFLEQRHEQGGADSGLDRGDLGRRTEAV